MSNVPSEFFDALRESPRAFSDVFAWMRTEMNFDTGGDSERVLVQYVSGRYYSSLGVPMSIGWPIVTTDEEHPEPVAVLSHRFWLRRFGGETTASATRRIDSRSIAAIQSVSVTIPPRQVVCTTHHRSRSTA